MDAIFQCSMNFMDEPLSRFESYMERASLQLKVELEEYVESTLDTSSSTFTYEAADSFLTKLKNAIKLIITRLKEFIQDTKMNIQKYKKEKATEERLEKLANALNKDSKLKSLKVKFKDYTPKARFIKNQKESLKKMVRKKDITADELKTFMTQYRENLSDLEKLGVVVTSVFAIKIVSKAFVNGVYEWFNNACDSADSSVDYLMDIDFSKFMRESVSIKEDIYDDTEIIAIYARAVAEMATDELKVQREIMAEYELALKEIESEIRKEFDEEE